MLRASLARRRSVWSSSSSAAVAVSDVSSASAMALACSKASALVMPVLSRSSPSLAARTWPAEPSWLAINSVSCTSAFSQYAAIAALDGPQDGVAAMVAEFGRRRDVVVAGLNALDGVSCVEPQGAFYAFPSIAGTGLTADELAGRLLHEAGVAALAGTAFGRYGEGFLRFSYANSVANIEAALEAMKFVLNS